jgi:DNA-binding CsgD family transcriptional regulator
MSVITSATTGTQCAVTLATLPARVPSGNECTVHIVQPVPEYETVTPFTDQFSMREYPARGNDGQMALGCAHLTARELDILRLLACGRSSLEIAAMLQISKATARNHIASILAKFGATTRLQAVTLASRAHII